MLAIRFEESVKFCSRVSMNKTVSMNEETLASLITKLQMKLREFEYLRNQILNIPDFAKNQSNVDLLNTITNFINEIEVHHKLCCMVKSEYYGRVIKLGPHFTFLEFFNIHEASKIDTKKYKEQFDKINKKTNGLISGIINNLLMRN